MKTKSNRICIVAGNRPQIMKIDKLIPHTLIWTGQHYDYEMSQIFFKEMGIPKPDYNLNCTKFGQTVDKLTKLLKKLKPKLVLVYGDTNSTLAGALAAAYLGIEIAHVESGLRSGNMAMPEEVNRILVDRLATFRFVPNVEAVENLMKEGIRNGVYMVGDVLFDAMNPFLPLKKTKDKYILLTVHRQENANQKTVQNILTAMAQVGEKVIFPMHPRLKDFKLVIPKNVKVIKPVGYKEMLKLESNAKHIVTDSGGVQREAYWFQVPSTILRNETEWNEIVQSGWGTLVGTDIEKIVTSVTKAHRRHDQPGVEFGAAKKIRTLLYNYL